MKTNPSINSLIAHKRLITYALGFHAAGDFLFPSSVLFVRLYLSGKRPSYELRWRHEKGAHSVNRLIERSMLKYLVHCNQELLPAPLQFHCKDSPQSCFESVLSAGLHLLFRIVPASLCHCSADVWTFCQLIVKCRGEDQSAIKNTTVVKFTSSCYIEELTTNILICAT